MSPLPTPLPCTGEGSERQALAGEGIMPTTRRIAIVTGTRAEYGLLLWTMRELQARGAELQLIVTGAHLSADHGMTVKHIEADGWPIAAKVDMQLKSD